LFRREDAENAPDILMEAELANLVAHRVAHLKTQMKNQHEHFSLKNDLMHHLWQK
jgi:hypothetical protein